MADITGTGTLKNFVSYTMDIGDIRKGVKCPSTVPVDDWLCSVSEFCTAETCPIMCAGTRYEYLWPSGGSNPPQKVSAPEYARLVAQWATSRLTSPDLCPTAVGAPFPPHFRAELTQILKRLFRVYAHIYLHHYRTFIAAEAAEHLNFCFKFFLYAVDEYQLLPDKEMEPLKVIIGIIRKHRDSKEETLQDAALSKEITDEGLPQQVNCNDKA